MLQPGLRPLGIGEILDRAVNLFVRRFAVFALILAVVAVPVAICQYAARPQMTAMATDFGRILTLPPGRTPGSGEIVRVLRTNNHIRSVGITLLTLGAILGVLSSTACIIAVDEAAGGKLPSVRAVYRTAVGRWLGQLVAAVTYLTLGFAAVTVLIVASGFVVLAIGALGTVSRPAATGVAILFAVIVGIGSLGLGALIYLSVQMTFISIALEDRNPFRGIAHGMRRTFSPAIFRRSLLVAAIVFVVSVVGAVVLLGIAAALSALTHVFALYTLVTVVGGVALNALLITFLVLYSTDIRVRREGYDLLLAADPRAALRS